MGKTALCDAVLVDAKRRRQVLGGRRAGGDAAGAVAVAADPRRARRRLPARRRTPATRPPSGGPDAVARRVRDAATGAGARGVDDSLDRPGHPGVVSTAATARQPGLPAGDLPPGGRCCRRRSAPSCPSCAAGNEVVSNRSPATMSGPRRRARVRRVDGPDVDVLVERTRATRCSSPRPSGSSTAGRLARSTRCACRP